MIKVKLRLDTTGTLEDVEFTVERMMAASKDFPYWTFWYTEDTNGDTRVRFFDTCNVKEVDLIGQNEEDKKLAQVIPLNQEHDDMFSGGDFGSDNSTR